MIRIFRAYHEPTRSQGAVSLKATPEEHRRRFLRVGGWLLWVIIMLACGYYGHFVWRQYFPSVTNSAANKTVRNYWLSDVHYVFKKNPLPARIEIDTDEAEGEGITPEQLLTSDEEAASEENIGTDHDALRLRVQQALEEVDDKRP